MRRIIVILIAALLMSCADPEIAKIGVISGETGHIAAISAPSNHAIRMALEKWNSDPDHTQIEIIFEDNQGKGAPSISAFYKLVDADKVSAVISDISLTTTTLASEANRVEVPVVAYVSTSPSVLGTGEYIYRTSPMNLEGMTLVAEHMINNNRTRIATLTELMDYPAALRDVFEPFYEGLNGEVVLSESFIQSDDFRSEITKLAASKPDAIMVFVQTPISAIAFAEQYEEFGISIPLYGSEHFGTDMAISLNKNVLEDVIVGSPKYNAEKMEELKEIYSNSAPPKILDWLYVATAYDAAWVLFEAIDEVGTDPKEIKNYLDGVEDFGGYSGFEAFDDNGDVAEGDYALFQFIDGKKIVIN